MGGDNRFVELGLVPRIAAARKNIIGACAQVAVDALTAVGFDLGLAHVEVKYTARGGPQLIEVNPRPAGDRIDRKPSSTSASTHPAWSWSCASTSGSTFDAEVPTTPVRGAAIRFLTADPGQGDRRGLEQR